MVFVVVPFARKVVVSVRCALAYDTGDDSLCERGSEKQSRGGMA